jgi:hypothetical protein
MNRLDYYYRQKVTEAELDLGFQYVEDAFSTAMWATHGYGRRGVVAGFQVEEQAVPDMTVSVGPGLAVDTAGRVLSWLTSAHTLDCSVDYNSVSTAVSIAGQEKYLAVYILADRALFDPRTDGNSNTVYFERAEAIEYRLVQGTQAAIGTAPEPADVPSGVRVALIHLVFGQGTITNSDIASAFTLGGEGLYNQTGSPNSIYAGTQREAVEALLGYLNDHLAGPSSHPATDIDYGGGAAWANGDLNGAMTVEAALDRIFDLGSTLGASLVGAGMSIGGAYELLTETVAGQLQELLAYLNGDVTTAIGDVASDLTTLDGAVVKLAGTQTITGQKTFNSGKLKAYDIELSEATDQQITFAAPIAITKLLPFGFFIDDGATGQWIQELVNTGGYYGPRVRLFTPTSGSLIWMAFSIPDGATLTEVRVYCNGGGGHGGSLPAVMPKVTVSRRASTTASTVGLGNASDSSANAAAYDSAHEIAVTGLSQVANRGTYDFIVAIESESGANSQPGFSVYGVRIGYEVVGIDPR